MTAVAILREETEPGRALQYRAIASNIGRAESVGRTAGEALDALTAQLGDREGGTLVVVQPMRPDTLFSQKQIARLQELMQRAQAGKLAAGEQIELGSLINEELLASGQRSAASAAALGR